MFKKIALIGLMSLGSLYGSDVESRVDTPPKKRHKISLLFKAIIPSILSYAFLEGIIQAYKNNPNKQQLVAWVKYTQWAPLIIGLYYLNIWTNTDLKEWALSKPAVPDPAP